MENRIPPALLVSGFALFTWMDGAQAQQPSRTGTEILLRVVVPTPNAKLWIENVRTRPTGTHRTFISPPLDMGQGYVYTIKSAWLEQGREITQERKVKVRAGQEVLVDFTAPESPAERPLTPPIAPGRSGEMPSERPLTPPIAPEQRNEGSSRRV
jgi:uncharacterized protein (TIGR03000 family)